MRTHGSVLAVFVLAAAGLLSACSTPSLTPLYSEEKREVVAEPGIEGSWRKAGENADDGVVYTIERSTPAPEPQQGLAAPPDRPTYRLTVQNTSRQGTNPRFDVHIVRLGDHLFADLYPDARNSRVADEFGLTYLPAHVPIRFKIKGDTLTFWQTNVKSVSALLKDQPGLCPHAWADDVAVLTGSPRQVQSFFIDLAGRPERWEAPEELQRLVAPAK